MVLKHRCKCSVQMFVFFFNFFQKVSEKRVLCVFLLNKYQETKWVTFMLCLCSMTPPAHLINVCFYVFIFLFQVVQLTGFKPSGMMLVLDLLGGHRNPTKTKSFHCWKKCAMVLQQCIKEIKTTTTKTFEKTECKKIKN